MINYRSLKKMLGETSLERKCRLLFGAALMTLITASFWIYAYLTRGLVESQQVGKAEALVPEILYREHVKRFANKVGTVSREVSDSSVPELNWKEFQEQIASVDELKLVARWSLVLTTDTPANEAEHQAMRAFEQDALDTTTPDAPDRHSIDEDTDGSRVLNYYKPVKVAARCIDCHNGTRAVAYAENELVGMATVRLSMAGVEVQLSHNRAILLASAIVTTFIAMLVAYVIVRYIIVKPVLHLKDVSDEIARGNLNLRAEINTGDEFEELSHAFNRMLRHMTTANDELRGVNDNLDAKVDQLAQANLELFNNNALKDEFLATMSHELRTPLNSILGFSDVLANAANLDDRQKRYVDNIRTSGRNLMVQINDLLDLAKIESGQMKIQPSPACVRDLIDAQINQVMPLADQKNIELRVQQPETEIPQVHQDAGKMRQILTNLLSNAIKFTPEGGRVRVSSELLENDTFEICVEDTGIGIPMHEQATIFEKFRQGSTTSGQRDHVKREYGGTGLGLSIVRELSRLLGGDVYLESEFGKGSVFMVRLPLEAPPELPDASLILESPSSPGLNRITSVDLLNPPPTETEEQAAP
ncbi:MAG: ATP-binding protein [Planctomycetaceae bacterium]